MTLGAQIIVEHVSISEYLLIICDRVNKCSGFRRGYPLGSYLGMSSRGSKKDEHVYNEGIAGKYHKANVN